MEQKNRRLLSHDGGQLLLFLINRLSIPREVWVHTYVFEGQKRQLPTHKGERLDFLAKSEEKLIEFIKLNKPCVVVAMGKQACETFTGMSILKKRAGTRWNTLRKFREAGIGKVWVSQSADAALYDPVQCVSISRIIGRAAMEAGIDIKMNYDLPMFDFSMYTK